MKRITPKSVLNECPESSPDSYIDRPINNMSQYPVVRGENEFIISGGIHSPIYLSQIKNLKNLPRQ